MKDVNEVLSTVEAEIYDAILKHTTYLFYSYHTYHALYKDRALVTQLNAMAPSYFGNLQQLMMRDLIAQVCRLSDPVESCGKSNLSVRQLEQFSNVSDKEELANLLGSMDNTCASMRQFRNKFGSHNDLEHCLAKVELEFHPYMGSIERGISAIGCVVNAFESDLGLTHTSFNKTIEPLGDYQSFVAFLKQHLPGSQPGTEKPV